MLQFAKDLEGLLENLDHASNEYVPIEHRDPAARGFLVVINELTAGTEPTVAVARAMAAYNQVRGERKDYDRSAIAQKEQRDAEVAAEEEITRKVACPTCGAEAGLSCVGTGRSGGYRRKSHADRARLARSLNDGSAPVESEASDVG
ncbi:hypothetical protein [Streptomyces sp. NPDC059759]|uniref:zinc finger domain-containing protein n=1 Tax=Streptomyces sp. NPDC059759 TaxID=3346936 RepID=UPI00364ED495